MLKIRLARRGCKKYPCYRIVVADARAPRDGKFIAKIGHYHPMKKNDDQTRVVLDMEKIKKWMKHGARPTERVAKFLKKMNG